MAAIQSYANEASGAFLQKTNDFEGSRLCGIKEKDSPFMWNLSPVHHTTNNDNKPFFHIMYKCIMFKIVLSVFKGSRCTLLGNKLRIAFGHDPSITPGSDSLTFKENALKEISVDRSLAQFVSGTIILPETGVIYFFMSLPTGITLNHYISSVCLVLSIFFLLICP